MLGSAPAHLCPVALMASARVYKKSVNQNETCSGDFRACNDAQPAVEESCVLFDVFLV